MSLPQTIGLEIHNITFKNRRFKFHRAVAELAKSLDIAPPLIKSLPKKEHRLEPYFYNIQQQLSDRWVLFYGNILENVYEVVTSSLGLPMATVETMRKAIDDGILRYKGGILKFIPFYRGRILYSPETGGPINKKDFEALIKAIENFLNRKTKKAGEQIVLDSVALGKLLRRMSKYQTSKEMKALTLEKLKYRGKTFDWIRDSVKNIKNALGEDLTRYEQARYQVAEDWAAQKVTRINSELREEIKDTILNGIRERRGKAQVSQDLFNRLGGLNKDWKRVADTELVNTSNLAGILEEVNHRPAGEKIYFKRYELPGCCDKCAKIDGTIVLWSDTPLDDDHIKDPHAKIAIWEGKAQDKKMTTVVPGTLHPNCRGGWMPWGGKTVDAVITHIENKGEMWDRAVTQVRKEYEGKGIENPTDQTKGYVDRINAVYQSLID
jgi:hypothetical protein